jgi:hypothetical protein
MLLAARGARVVVNDLGTGRAGGGRSEGPALEAAREIRELGGDAVASFEDVSTYDGAQRLASKRRYRCDGERDGWCRGEDGVKVVRRRLDC